MAYHQHIESDHIAKTLYQCKHCGSWINSKGILDEKLQTTKAVFCQYCKTAADRRANLAANAEIRKRSVGGSDN